MSLATKVARTLFGAYEGTRDVEARAAPRGTVALTVWAASFFHLGLTVDGRHLPYPKKAPCRTQSNFRRNMKT